LLFFVIFNLIVNLFALELSSSPSSSGTIKEVSSGMISPLNEGHVGGGSEVLVTADVEDGSWSTRALTGSLETFTVFMEERSGLM
jgi:hypothetical protein